MIVNHEEISGVPPQFPEEVEFENGVVKLGMVEQHIDAAIGYSADGLPLPEREFLVEPVVLYNVNKMKFRPVENLTRAECNTIEGRTKLLEWEQSRPYIDNDKEIAGFEMSAAPYHGRAFLPTKHTDPKMVIEYILSVNYNSRIPSPKPNYIYNGLWNRVTANGLLSHASDCEGYHPDLMFAAIEGHDITNRDEFRQVVERYAVDVDFDTTQSSNKSDHIKLTREQVIESLLDIYDNSQHLIDCLFATYHLFRTEKYETISQCPMVVQRVAIRNFLSTFRAYNSKSGKFDKVLEYNGAVASNTRKRLNIPDEVGKYADKHFKVEPLKDDPTSPKNTQEEHAENNRTFAVSTFAFDQRTDGLNNRQEVLFKEEMGIVELQMYDKEGNAIQENNQPKTEKLTAAHLNSWMANDTKLFKFFGTLLRAIGRSSQLDYVEFANRVKMAKTNEDIFDLYDATEVTIVINDYVREYQGNLTKKDAEDFVAIIDSLPREYFKFPIYVEKKTKNGKTYLWEVPDNQRRKYVQKGKARDITIYGRRFEASPLIIEGNAPHTTYTVKIKTNPVYFARMIDKYGNLTNYVKLNDAWDNFISSINKTDVVTPAVYKILSPIHRQCYAVAAQTARTLKKQKGSTTDYYDTERSTNFTRCISKESLYLAVLKNAGIMPTDTKTKQRVKKKIIDALELLKKNDICIDTFSSTADGKAWKILFIEPSK